MSDLIRWRDAVRGKSVGGRLILNGSFISEKAEPGDFDGIFIYVDNAHCKAHYGEDIWAFSEQAIRDFPQFCRVDGFDREKITRTLKGVLEVRRMIENNRQLAATLFQMESFADTLEGMHRHAQVAEPSVFAVTSGGFVNLIRERIAEARAYVESLPDAQEQPDNGSSPAANMKQASTAGLKTAA